MNTTIEASGELLLVYLSGELDHHTARTIREQTDTAIAMKQPRHLILDFKNVTFMDSAGIGLVMGRYRVMQSYKGTMEVRGVTSQTKKLFELAGIGSIAIIKEG